MLRREASASVPSPAPREPPSWRLAICHVYVNKDPLVTQISGEIAPDALGLSELAYVAFVLHDIGPERIAAAKSRALIEPGSTDERGVLSGS